LVHPVRVPQELRQATAAIDINAAKSEEMGAADAW